MIPNGIAIKPIRVEPANKPQSAAANIKRVKKEEDAEEKEEKKVKGKDEERKEKIEEMKSLLKRLENPNHDIQIEEVFDAIVELKIMEKEQSKYLQVNESVLMEGKNYTWKLLGNVLTPVED